MADGTKDLLDLDELRVEGGLTGRRHLLSLLVENRPGVLARIAGLFSRRGFNIDTLAVGPTEDPDTAVAREMALFRINAAADNRAEIIEFTQIFRAHIVDVSRRSITVEVTGTTEKIDSFERMVRPHGLIEMARTGEVAIARARAES
jgi:acetolactate synthase-1/3 small subunit